MKSVLIILMAACVFTAAMVPRDRRALNSEEDIRPEATTTTSGKPKEVCAKLTPCGWSVYKPHTKLIDQMIINTYCDCLPEEICEFYEDDSVSNVYVHRCKIPEER